MMARAKEQPMDIFIKKLGATVAVDWDALPASIQAQVIDYGLKQKLSDGLSEMSVAKGNTVEEMTFTVGEAIASLVAGEWSARGRTADPVAQRAKAIAKGLVAKQSRAALQAAMAGRDMSLDDIKAELVKRLASSDRILTLAMSQVQAEHASGVDLDGLL
jgi:hypothetical protein